MIPYFGKSFAGERFGQSLKAVTCGQCGTAYKYLLTRRGTGSGTAPYMLGQDAARGRADREAEAHLQRRLTSNAELVPCPKCRWVNEDLVRRFRWGRYERVGWAIFLLMVLGFVGFTASAAMLPNLFEYDSKVPGIISLSLLLLVPLAPVIVLGGRRWLRGRIDPNRHHPRPPTLPPLTPPALVDHGRGLEPVPHDEESETAPPAGWAYYRSGAVDFPPMCCVCLGDAETAYDVPFKVSDDGGPLPVPLCGPCAASLRSKWNLVAGATPLALAGAALLLTYLIPFPDELARWAFVIIVGGLGGVMSMAFVPTWLSRPYSDKSVDANRCVRRLRAAHPEYAALLADAQRAADGTSTGSGVAPPRRRRGREMLRRGDS